MYDNNKKPTGRENTIIKYCRKCEWCSGRIALLPSGANPDSQVHCPDCGTTVSFVRYEGGVEDAAAALILKEQLPSRVWHVRVFKDTGLAEWMQDMASKTTPVLDP